MVTAYCVCNLGIDGDPEYPRIMSSNNFLFGKKARKRVNQTIINIDEASVRWALCQARCLCQNRVIFFIPALFSIRSSWRILRNESKATARNRLFVAPQVFGKSRSLFITFFIFPYKDASIFKDAIKCTTYIQGFRSRWLFRKKATSSYL